MNQQFITLYRLPYNTVRHKDDTIVKVIKTSPPNMMFRKDLSDQRLVD
jgi:hypothetical protein